jgi:hypothetical protein
MKQDLTRAITLIQDLNDELIDRGYEDEAYIMETDGYEFNLLFGSIPLVRSAEESIQDDLREQVKNKLLSLSKELQIVLGVVS